MWPIPNPAMFRAPGGKWALELGMQTVAGSVISFCYRLVTQDHERQCC